jgi:hypothetical protein
MAKKEESEKKHEAEVAAKSEADAFEATKVR